MVIYQIVSQTLTFSESLKTNQHVIAINDFLDMVDTDQSYDLRENIVQGLTFFQTGKYTISGHRSIAQSLVFTQSAKKGQLEQLYQNLNFTQSVDPGNKWPLVTQILNYTEYLSFDLAKAGFDYLSFAQTINLNFCRVQTISQHLSFAQFPVIYKPDPGFISGPPYEIHPSPTVSFAFGNITVSLRPPDFGNTDSMQLRRIQRETRGGDLIIYRDPNWSTSETFELDFSYIDDVSARAMQDFIRGTLGQLVIYTDHEGNQWLGLFNSPDLEITTPGRFNNSFKIKFEVIFA